MKETQAMIITIRHPHAPRRHGHHTPRAVELPERRALAAPGPRALQLTSNTLQPWQPISTKIHTRLVNTKD